MAHQILEIRDDLVALRRPVVEFGQIAPDGLLFRVVGIDRERRLDLAACVAGEPLRPARGQLAVLRRMVDDEVHDDAQPVPLAPPL